MPPIAGKYTTYDTTFLDIDVRALANLVEPQLTVSYDLFPILEPVNTKEIEWYNAKRYSLGGTVGTGGWTDGTTLTALPIDAVLTTVINVGDVLKIESEYVVVSSVQRGADTIAVFARGAGGTTGAAHIATTPIKIIGNANVEGTVDLDSITEDNLKVVNYHQILEEVVEITHTGKNQKYRDVTNKLDEQRAKAVIRALKKLNLSAIFGKPDAGTKTTPRLAGGIDHFILADADATNVNVGGDFSETKLEDAIIDVVDKGGNPNILLCSTKTKVKIINKFNAYASTSAGTKTYTIRTERIAGNIISFYESDKAFLQIVTDPALSGQGVAYLLNTRKMGKSWFADDFLRFAPEPSNSRTMKETLQGQFTFAVKDTSTDHARFYGITNT